jgi:hypothetical protein
MNSLKNKTIFTFKIDNVVDIITNSSSELFVLKAETKAIAEEMIRNVYPDYLNEYEELKEVSELTNEELDPFMGWHCSPHMWPASKEDYPLLDGFTFDELYEPKIDWKTGLQEPPAWNGELQYELRKNYKDPEDKWNYSFVTDENREKVIQGIKNTIGNFLLYSKNDNPDWDMQEKLMEIGRRYHLG